MIRKSGSEFRKDIEFDVCEFSIILNVNEEKKRSIYINKL